MKNSNRDTADIFVSVVFAWRGELEALYSSLRELSSYLTERYSDYEIVVVDSGCGELIRKKVSSVLSRVPCVRFLELSSAVSAEVAMAAGVENAIGDFVAFVNPESDPVDLIGSAVGQCRKGADVVLGTSDMPATFAYSVIRPLCKWILDLADYRLPRNWSGFCCFSRRVVNAAGDTGRIHHQFISRILRAGYGFQVISYSPKAQFLKKKGVLSAIPETIELLVFNSTAPLRWINLLGLAGSFMAFLFAVYSLLMKIFSHGVVEGWTTTILFMSFPFMLLFTILSFLGEYMLRLLNTIGGPTDYSVAREQTSQTMVNKNRINVLTEAIAEFDEVG